MHSAFVAITMDCEPTLSTTHSSATGPSDFAMSERAIVGYFDIAASYGFPVSFFVHPEAIEEQADLFKDLAGRGACIGLHLHPWKYGQSRHGGTRYMGHFGQFSYGDQLALLNETADIWGEAMGARPLYFRPGTFSANDATFKAMAAAGFRGGSLSAPDRVFREIYSVWTGAERDPHRLHPEFRLRPGAMDLVDMPLTVDLSQPVDFGQNRNFHADLRPDIDWLGQYGITTRSVAENIVSQLVGRSPAVPVVNTVSHNQYEYKERSDATRQRFVLMLDELSRALDQAGIRPQGATMAEIADKVLETSPLPEKLLYI